VSQQDATDRRLLRWSLHVNDTRLVPRDGTAVNLGSSAFRLFSLLVRPLSGLRSDVCVALEIGNHQGAISRLEEVGKAVEKKATPMAVRKKWP
jgi:hypothetical protein